MNAWELFKNMVGLNNKGKKLDTHEASSSARDPKSVQVKRVGQAITGSSGGSFEDNPVDLEEVQRAYHSDSYIRRAIDKYVGLMFKNGWNFNGKNDTATEYVWTRLKLMAEGTSIATDEMLSQLAFDYVLFGNAFLAKARSSGSKGNTGINAVGYSGSQPIAGYFVLPATTMKVSRDDDGTITGYEQDVGGGSAVSFKVEDIVHFTYKKPTGRAYGVPFVWNVLDDVKILRDLEENVARLVYRHLFPLYMYKVGLDKPGYEATDEEIEELREQIRDMPMDGGLVVPERHDISVIGTEGQAINADPYLQYYRQRVFTGLGVSDTVMGIGGTANKSTSDNQAADLFDMVKEFQRTFAEQLQFSVINEILFEGGFDPTLNPDDEVLFYFEEIELDAKIKKENHLIQMFTQNAITHDEMRHLMGLDPVADESRLYFNMVTVATANATGGEADTSGQEAANNAGDNKDQPENQNGKQKSPGETKASTTIPISEKVGEKVLTEKEGMVTLNSELPIDSYTDSMTKFWKNLSEDVVDMVKKGKSFDQVKGFATEIVRQSLRGQNRQYITQAMMKGLHIGREKLQQPSRNNLSFTLATEKIIKMSDKYINKLLDDMNMLISESYSVDKAEERLAKVIGAFNSNKYRLSFIPKSELYRAYNYGVATAGLEAKLKTAHIVSHEGCDKCLEKQGEIVLTDIDLLEAIPPHHANCECLVELNISQEEVQSG